MTDNESKAKTARYTGASRSQSFEEGLQARAEAQNWAPGEVDALLRERDRSRRD